MLYLLIICIVICAIVCWCKIHDIIYSDCDYNHHYCLYKKLRRHMYLSIILLIFIILSVIVGTVIACNSDFLSITTEESSNTYQVTDFSAVKSKKNLSFDGDYETNYSITIEDDFLIKISSQDSDTKIICDNYNPTTVTIEKNHYFKWWFLSTVDAYKYTFS